MNTMKSTVLGLLIMVFIWGGGTSNAYKSNENSKTLVHHPINIIVALE